MRSLRLIIIILFSALALIIIVTREPTCASTFLPQQPAVSGGSPTITTNQNEKGHF